MENMLSKLISDIKLMNAISERIGRFENEYFFISDLNDKRNYNEKRCILIAEKIRTLKFELSELKTKWGV